MRSLSFESKRPGNRNPTCVNSAVCEGMETRLMQIECGFTRGFAGLQLIGSTSEVSRDGKERARVALESLGIQIPPQRLVVSFTPADVKMDGNQFDLPVAVTLALLLKSAAVFIDPARWLFAAELGLGGELRPVRGAVSFALAAQGAGLDGLIVSPENLPEVSVLMALSPHRSPQLQALAFSTLAEVLQWLYNKSELPAAESRCEFPRAELPQQASVPSFDDMLLNPTMELAALTACSGMHSLLLRGAPGTGKSMLAARLTSILPNMPSSQHTEVMRIYSNYLERLPTALLAGRPPYRAPHHQASAAAIMGSGETPGELALAHGGVLFLDELPEFRRDLLEALREPLEIGEVRISRSRHKTVWKASVMLVAACNNCPCGWTGSSRRICICGNGRVLSYRQRLSGPILDRIDLHVNVPEPATASADLFLQLAKTSAVSPTQRMLARVVAARAFGAKRNATLGIVCNRDLPSPRMIEASGLEPAVFADLVNAYVPRHASARSVLRCLRVARTLADLNESAAVREEDLRQAWCWQSDHAARERGEDPSMLE